MPRDWSRREVLKAGAAVGTALLAGGGVGCGDGSGRGAGGIEDGGGGDDRSEGALPTLVPKHIVLITADDLGWRDLSSYGSRSVRTSNIDRLVQGGVSFSRAFDVTSSCSSSRATYATGQYPHTNGVTGLVHRFPEFSLPAGTPTLASHLLNDGWATAIEGKWHLAAEDLPDAFGYAEVMPLGRISDASRSVDFVHGNADRRFFLEINYMNPHRNASRDFVQHPDHPVDPDALVLDEWRHLPDVPGARAELAAYFSQIARMDAMVGELLVALDSESILDETLIAFISDNGAPFPLNKTTLYDRGTGTPLIFHWPAALPAGRERDDLVSSVDLMPTLLEAAGIPIPPEVEGRSILPLLLDPKAFDGRQAVFCEMTFHSAPTPMRGVRTDRWRYIRNYSDHPIGLSGGGQDWVQDIAEMNLPEYPWGRPRVPEEVYDVVDDPQQLNNLREDPNAAAILEALRALLDEHMRNTADPYLGREFEMTTATPHSPK